MRTITEREYDVVEFWLLSVCCRPDVLLSVRSKDSMTYVLAFPKFSSAAVNAEGVSDCCDALCGVSATAERVQATELVGS